MRRSIAACSAFTLAVGLIAGLAGPHTANAFNWNKETVNSFYRNRGKMEAPLEKIAATATSLALYPGGHNLATRRAMAIAIGRAAHDPQLRKTFEYVYGESLGNLSGEHGFTFQKILWGNFSNEVQTMLDAPAGAEEALAKFMSWSYSLRRGVVGPDNRHSRHWQEKTGYTSSNHIHSMLVTSDIADENLEPVLKPDGTLEQPGGTFTQMHSMHRIRNHVQLLLESVLRKLVNVTRARNDKIHVIENDIGQSSMAILGGLYNLHKHFSGPNEYWKDSRFEFAMRSWQSPTHDSGFRRGMYSCCEKCNSGSLSIMC
jgi:hypothetical protein